MDGGEPDIPIYKVIECTGPTNTRVYKVAVYFRGKRLASSSGHSIQQAEMEAAKKALENSSELFPQLDYQKRVMAKTLGVGMKRQKGKPFDNEQKRGGNANSDQQQRFIRKRKDDDSNLPKQYRIDHVRGKSNKSNDSYESTASDTDDSAESSHSDGLSTENDQIIDNSGALCKKNHHSAKCASDAIATKQLPSLERSVEELNTRDRVYDEQYDTAQEHNQSQSQVNEMEQTVEQANESDTKADSNAKNDISDCLWDSNKMDNTERIDSDTDVSLESGEIL